MGIEKDALEKNSHLNTQHFFREKFQL